VQPKPASTKPVRQADKSESKCDCPVADSGITGEATIHFSVQDEVPPPENSKALVLSPLGIQPALFPIDGIGPEETHYFTFFLTEVGCVMPYFECFPQMVNEIFNRATTDQALLQTILSVSHLILDYRMGRSLIPVFQHQQKALGALQRSISAVDITEALAIAVTMLAWLNICQSNPTASCQHLHGVFLIFQEIQKRQVAGISPSSLLMQIWRVALRLDSLASMLYFPRKPLFTPAPIDQDDLHRPWIRLSLTEPATEWTLASFALDNLMHRCVRVAFLAHQLRQSQPDIAQSQIEAWTTPLLEEHDQWYNRDIVACAELFQRIANSDIEEYPPVISSNQFLDYPPLYLYSTFYGNMLNCWRAIYIYIDLILHPHIGPGEKTSRRFQLALDMCRTYASLGTETDLFPSGKVWSMNLAGVALGGVRQSPRETAWVHKYALTDLTKIFPCNVKVLVCVQLEGADCRRSMLSFGRWKGTIGTRCRS
jgi:Fungal specific transcription factor domain